MTAALATPISTALRRPRFLHEVVVLPFEDGLLVDGMSHLRTLRGSVARDVLQKLIPLMDGSRDVIELESAVPDIPPEHVRRAVSLLFSNGLIEDAAPTSVVHDGTCMEALSFFRRFAEGTHLGLEAFERLRASRVALILDTNECRDLLKEMLIASGTGTVDVLAQHELTAWMRCGPDSTRDLVMSFVTSGEDHAGAAELDDLCCTVGVSWLRVVIDRAEGYADLGPLFRGRQTPCYRCFVQVRSRQRSPHAAGAERATLTDVVFWAGMAAIEAIYRLSDFGPRIADKSFRRYDLRNGRSRELYGCRVPGCARCRPLSAAQPNSPDAGTDVNNIDTVVVFEEGIGAESSDAGPQLQRRGRPLFARSFQTKRLEICQRHELDSGIPDLAHGILDALEPQQTASDNECTIHQLGAVLKLTAGIRSTTSGPEIVKRWAPTAGNLGSVELYVVIRNVVGLADGVYLYQAEEHSLASMRWHDDALAAEEFMRRALARNATELPNVAVIFTAAYHRIARKYNAFGYRLINLDAGAAVSQLQIVAKSLGLHPHIATRWPDDLIEEHLRLEFQNEQVTAVVLLYGRWDPERHERQRRLDAVPRVRSGRPPSLKAAREFSDLSLSDTLAMLVRESRVQERDLNLEPFAVPSELRPEPSGGPSVALPPSGVGGISTRLVLSERQSVRLFAPGPIDANHLSTMLDYANRADWRNWPDEHRDGHELRFLVLARRVRGVESGTYCYLAESHALTLVRPAPSHEETVELFVQGELAAAPFQVFVVSNLAFACARHGAFGHRQALLRAGAAVHRLSAAAAGVGIGGVIVAGLIPNALRATLRLDGYTQAALVAFVGGREITPH